MRAKNMKYLKNNLPSIATMRYGILLLLCTATTSLSAQENPEMLDVYKISFDPTAKSGRNKTLGASMTVCYHPDYLHATQTNSDGKKTSWLIRHPKKMLLQIDGKQGLPLNYATQLKTNVYLPGETIDSAANTKKPADAGDWDNENEYNGPGIGHISFTEDTLTVAGYVCQKAVIAYKFPGQCKVGEILKTTVWYSPQLPPFYLPPFTFLQKIPGAALMICMEDSGGATACYIASSVAKEKKPVSFFKPANDIQIMYPPKLH